MTVDVKISMPDLQGVKLLTPFVKNQLAQFVNIQNIQYKVKNKQKQPKQVKTRLKQNQMS